MGMTMRMRLSETVDTSKNEVVRPLELNQVSPVYIKAFKDITEDVLRFNFPEEYSIRLGLLHDIDCVYCARSEDKLIFSAFETGLEEEIKLEPYLYKHNGFPRSTMLSEYDDQQFFLIPKYFVPFESGDKIVYKYIKEENDIERHVTCERQ